MEINKRKSAGVRLQSSFPLPRSLIVPRPLLTRIACEERLEYICESIVE